jgi:hypothetical protein
MVAVEVAALLLSVLDVPGVPLLQAKREMRATRAIACFMFEECGESGFQ